MGSWGADGFVLSGVNFGSLTRVVSQLNPKAKKAMYGAAMSKTIHKGTWNGCAFNAGGIEIGNLGVTSVEAAAKSFELPAQNVSRFIQVWDSLPGSEDECTKQLIEALENVGLFTEIGEKRPRVIRKKIYEAYEKKMMEQVTQEIENQTLDAPVCEAADLLFAGASA